MIMPRLGEPLRILEIPLKHSKEFGLIVDMICQIGQKR